VFCGIAAGSLVAVSGKPAAAQSADAQERCTEDVMRLCSEFVPDADSIVVCLKAKRLQLTSSCLNALSPAPLEPLALQVSPTKKNAKSATHSVTRRTPHDQREPNIKRRLRAESG